MASLNGSLLEADSKWLEPIDVNHQKRSFLSRFAAEIFQSCSPGQVADRGPIFRQADKILSLALNRSGGNLLARPVESLDEIKAAFLLTYREYVQRGYCQADLCELHFSVYSLLPESRVIVLKQDQSLIGTISLIIDSSMGLPMEAQYSDEVNQFRKPGRKLAEVGLLALDSKVFPRGHFSLTNIKKQHALFALFKGMFDQARQAGVTDLMIAMHPKHRLLYTYLLFETIGAIKKYRGARDNLAIPMRLDVPKFAKVKAVNTQYFFAEAQRSNHGSFSWDTDSVRQLLRLKQSLQVSREQKNLLQELYPGLCDQSILGQLEIA
jgi:hypothetical protein